MVLETTGSMVLLQNCVAMKAVIQVTLFIAAIALANCTKKNYGLYSDWDANADRNLDRTEFINAYAGSEFFTKWSVTEDPITYAELYETVYRSVDEDSSLAICPEEFYHNMRPLYFGMFTDRFEAWDSNNSHTISLSEFNSRIARSNLAYHWDLNTDHYVSELEMGEGMFRVCDLDDNGSVDDAEFNLWKYFR
jgi:hypothetical protein